jgi:RNA polymerase sigma-70 factor (ECF subfamily)
MKMLEKEINKHLEDKEIILQLQNGDDLALSEIMSRYKTKLFPFIYNYTKDSSASSEILQEVFVKIYFRAKTYNSKYSFSTWIHQIAINLCRDHHKKQKLNRWLSLDHNLKDDNNNNYHEIIADPNSNIESLVKFRRELFILDKEIEKLPHKLKTSLILFTLEGFSQEKCAEILGVTPKTIETRVRRARKILTKRIITNL